MPASKTKQNNKEENGVAGTDVNGLTPDIAALLASSDIFQRILKVDSENKQLRARNEALETTNTTNMDTIAEKRKAWSAEKASLERTIQDEQNEIEKLREAKAKVDELAGRIKEQETQLLDQVETIKKKSDEITLQQALCDKTKEELDKQMTSAKELGESLQATQKTLDRSKEDLDIANDDLDEIRSFLAPLHHLKDGKTRIHKALATTFHQFLDFFTTELSLDMSTDAMATAAVEKLSIPLPASNSTAAKQMRVAAALAIASEALNHHVFRQALVSDELDRVLETLAGEYPEHESHVRAVLLKLHRVFPEETKAAQQANVDSAVKYIVGALGQWVQNATGFDSRLRPLCESAAESWNLALEVENRVVVHFGFQRPEDWRPVPLAGVDKKPASTPAGSPTKAPANRNGNTNGNANGNGNKSQKQAQHPPPAQLNRNELHKAVWPVFMAHPFDEEGVAAIEMVSCGYVLTKAQEQEANEEVAREESTFKLARQCIRRQPMVAAKKRRNSLAPSAVRASLASNAG